MLRYRKRFPRINLNVKNAKVLLYFSQVAFIYAFPSK